MTNEEYIPRDDESEAALINGIRSTHGIGEVSYLEAEDVKQYSMSDYGLDVNEDLDNR